MRIKNMGEKFIEFNLNAPNGPRNSWHLMGTHYQCQYLYLYLNVYLLLHPYLHLHIRTSYLIPL